MHIKRHLWKIDLQIVLVSVLALSAAIFIPFDSAQAGFKVLYAFSKSDGSGPVGRLTRKAYILYGTTAAGGTYDRGTVFKLAPDGTETMLHAFTGFDDGSNPDGVIMDKAGNLYGAATNGGGGGSNYGTVFRLTPDGTLTTLHTFELGSDGVYPAAGLKMDKAGNLYGTTELSGAYNGGTVFKLAPDGTLTTLHSFTGGSDGKYANGDLITDHAAGNLYGTTLLGGAGLVGTVFKLAPDGALTTLYSFTDGSDGRYPRAGVIMDGNANLYGTTSEGGANRGGTVFKLAPDGALTTLYSFSGKKDGDSPWTGLVMDDSGNLYGTTTAHGRGGFGTVYKVALDGTFTLLHSLDGGQTGSNPEGRLIMGPRGKLYGTTQFFGPHDEGTVFSLLRHDRAAASEDER